LEEASDFTITLQKIWVQNALD